MEHSKQLKIYKRRNPQTTSLLKLLNCHFVDFEECYDKLFQKKYGFYRLVISRVVRKYLECGDLHQGDGVSFLAYLLALNALTAIINSSWHFPVEEDGSGVSF